MKPILLIVTVFFAQTIFAQQKFGHVNVESVFLAMPEAKSAQTNLEAFSKLKSDEIDKMQKEYQINYDNAVAKNKTLNESNKDVVLKELEVLSIELESLKKRIEDAAKKAQEEVIRRQGELFTPVNAKFMTALKSVYKEKTLSYVFSVSGREGDSNLLLWDNGIDLTEDVKKKLGLSK